MLDRSKMGCGGFVAGGVEAFTEDAADLLFGEVSDLLVSSTLRFRGWAFSTKVQSCLWNSHRTQRRPSCSTHLLLRRRQPSQGRSRRGRWGALCCSCLRAGRDSLLSIKRCLGGDQAAISREQGRGASGWTAIAVAMAAVCGVYKASGGDVEG